MACVPSGKKDPGITAIDLAYHDIERIGDRRKTPCYEGSRRESCKSFKERKNA
jgi:hypothetical protein